MDAAQKLLGDNPTIWVFGYGSLLWKPDFQYKSKKIGYIKDYERRFYQGNVTFRGKPGQPGRVANLEKKKGGQAWGVAYEISGREEVTQVLQALYKRETTSGGYVTMVTTFYPRNKQNHLPKNRSSQLSDNRNEFSAQDSRTYLDILSSQPISMMQRMNSSISNESIDDISGDEELFEHTYEKTRNSSAISQQDSSLDPHIVDQSFTENLNNVIFNQNGFRNDNTIITESANFDEHSNTQSLSISNELLAQRKQKDDNSIEENLVSLPVLLYTATHDNDLYLGADDVTSMARQIVSASGSAGSNVEYVTKIADYVRKYIPEDEDSHLFSLDLKIREEIYRHQSVGTTRFQLGFADLAYDFHDLDHEIIAEPVMAS